MYQANSHIQGLKSCAKTQHCLIAIFQNVVTFLSDVNAHILLRLMALLCAQTGIQELEPLLKKAPGIWTSCLTLIEDIINTVDKMTILETVVRGSFTSAS